jgi:hypothetical protein
MENYISETRITPRRAADCILALLAALPLSACGAGSQQATSAANGPHPSPTNVRNETSASAQCAAALGKNGFVTAAPTTIGEIRAARIGGPAPGLNPGRDAFPGMPATTAAAWCWTSGPSDTGSDGRTWHVFVAANGRAEHYFDLTYPGSETPPPGQPSVP